MSALPSVEVTFLELESRLEKEPEGTPVEIVHGVYLVAPHPPPRHGSVQGSLVSELDELLGRSGPLEFPEWLLVVGADIRSARAFSRLIPDVAGWKRSGQGWPDLDVTPVEKAPDWVAEVLSPSTEAVDRGPKRIAYGLMGVASLWLVDPRASTVEVFRNVRGEMVPDGVYRAGDTITGEPFGTVSVPVAPLLS